MDVFTQLEDTVGEFYSSSFTNSADHSLQSPDMSALATSPQSIFMYEHDSEPAPHSKPSIDNNNTRGDRMDYVSDPLANPLFEAPCWPEEMANFGVDDLTDSFMSESSLCGSSFNDSVKDSVWDFAGYDDVSSPLQHPEDDFLHSPTLAELNMDDTHDVFGGGNQQHSAFSQTTQLHTKTKPVLIKQSSHKHGHHVRQQERSSSLRRKAQASSATRDHKYSSLFTVAAKSNPLPTNSLHHKKLHHDQIRPESSCNDLTMVETLQAESSGSAGSSRTNCLSFTNLLGRRTRTFATSLPTMRQQRSPLLEDAKIIVKMEPRDGVDIVDESSVDRKWEEIKSFIHQDVMNKTTMVKNEEAGGDETSVTEGSPTKLTLKKHAHGYSVKSEKKDFSSSIQTRDDGFDSHDEGLGSEHDDMEEVSEDEDDGRMEDDEASDLSDVEEEPGLSSSSMQAAAGKYRTKSRRSEYDDMTPNPRKLLHIGNELRKLNKIISDMAPVSELSGSARNRCRKEKNKLASRACRLKKKAQHEANKIKLSGLEDESTRLMVVLTAIKKDMVQKVRRPHIQFDGNLTQILDDLIKNNLGQMVAGHTNEYVNRVMERTAREKSVNLKSTIDS